MKSTNDNPTPTTLREILRTFRQKTLDFNPSKPSNSNVIELSQATQSIKEQLKALLPEKKTVNERPYYQESERWGYNQAIDQIEKAIEEWVK